MTTKNTLRAALGAISSAAMLLCAPAHAAWEPTAPIELVVPAGKGGGADQMARFLSQMAKKHGLTKQPINVVNKPANAGAEGFLDVKASKGDPHKLVITLSNLFTTPLATRMAFSWRDLTPVSMLALDQFVLWVNAESPYKTGKDYIDAIRTSPDNTFKMGGTGSKQEDQIITALLEKTTGKKLTYVPFGGGGEVARKLVAKEIDSSVNNPIEAESAWRSGKLRALCVFDKNPLPYPERDARTKLSWADIPSCTTQGLNGDYLMLRGIFMTPGATPEQVAYYITLITRIRALPEWQYFMEKGAFKQTMLIGPPYVDWVTKNEVLHQQLMRDAGFLAK